MDKTGHHYQLATTLESEQLLSEKQQTDVFGEDESPGKTPPSWSGSKQHRSYARLIYHIVIHALLVAAVIYIGISHIWTSKNLNPYTNTPAANVIELHESEVDPLTHSHRSIYSGEPTKENIAAWDDLVEPTFLGITEEEVRRLGAVPERAVRLADNQDRFLAGSAVYHHLHCLRRLRWMAFQDYFYPNMSQLNPEVVLPHLAHCIEGLRYALMCFPDLNLYTFEWDEPNAIRPDPHTRGTRQCLNWETLDNWSRERSVGYDPVLIGAAGYPENVHMI